MTPTDVAAIATVLALGVVAGWAAFRAMRPRYRMPTPPAFPLAAPVAIDPDYLVQQLQDSIARSPGHQRGCVRLGVVVVDARWVEDSWRDRWRVTIRAGKGEIAVPPTYTDEAMFVAVLTELRRLAGGS